MRNGRLAVLIGLMLVFSVGLWFDVSWRAPTKQLLPRSMAAPMSAASEGTQRKRFRATGDELAAVNPLHLSLDSLSEVIERPLFSRSRRPYQPPPVRAYQPPPVYEPEPPSPELPTPGLILAGVVIGKNDRFALLEHHSSGKLLRLKEGESFEGWSLDALELQGAVLSGHGRRHTLQLFENKSGSEPGADTAAKAEHAAVGNAGIKSDRAAAKTQVRPQANKMLAQAKPVPPHVKLAQNQRRRAQEKRAEAQRLQRLEAEHRRQLRTRRRK